MKIDIYTFSANGTSLADKIKKTIENYENSDERVKCKLTSKNPKIFETNCPKIEILAPEQYVNLSRYASKREQNIGKSVEKSFEKSNCIIFIGAMGIAVRSIAPFIKNKKSDPAIICIDELGINVISVLSGHLGGANEITIKIARLINANPIITTATDINKKFSVDDWSRKQNLYICNLIKARDVSVAVLNNKKIGFYSDFKVENELPIEIDKNEKDIGLCISLNDEKSPFENTLNLIPRIISVGVGCRRGADEKHIYNAIKKVLDNNNISIKSVNSLNSIDLKSDENGIINVAKKLNVPFNIYNKNELGNQKGEFSHSDFVKSITGVDSVCERSALAGSIDGKLIVKKIIENSVTVAIAINSFSLTF